MKALINPHDKYFKENMGNPEIAKDFLENYLPKALREQMDLGSLSLQKDSYIDGKLQEYFSDLLYRFRLKEREAYLYLLFEHKSYPDKDTALQLLRYIVEIYQGLRRQKKRGLLPPVIPLVFYHGREAWKMKPCFSALIEGYDRLPEEVRKYLPAYEYLLYDLRNFPEDTLQGEIPLLVFLRMQKSIFAGERELLKTLSETIGLLEKLGDPQRRESLFELMIRYLFHAREDIELEEIEQEIGEVSKERREQLMTIAAKLLRQGWEEGMEKGLEKGMEKGMEKGLEKGMEEKARAIAENMLQMGAEVDFVVGATGLCKEEVQEIEKKRRAEEK